MPSKPARHGATAAPSPRALPAVKSAEVRPSAAKRGYDRRWRQLRASIAAVRPAICVDCGNSYASKYMHLDHDVPKSRGGSDDPSNLVWRCNRCHAKKTAREDGGFGNDVVTDATV